MASAAGSPQAGGSSPSSVPASSSEVQLLGAGVSSPASAAPQQPASMAPQTVATGAALSKPSTKETPTSSWGLGLAPRPLLRHSSQHQWPHRLWRLWRPWGLGLAPRPQFQRPPSSGPRCVGGTRQGSATGHASSSICTAVAWPPTMWSRSAPNGPLPSWEARPTSDLQSWPRPVSVYVVATQLSQCM